MYTFENSIIYTVDAANVMEIWRVGPGDPAGCRAVFVDGVLL